MKALRLIILAVLLFISGNMYAQVSLDVTIGTPPPWGPVDYVGVRYYYLPDIDAYYDINTGMFIYYYYGGGYWVHHPYLPWRYRDYDLYRGCKVGLRDYRGTTPYAHYREHRMHYPHGYRVSGGQRTIGRRPDNYHGGWGNRPNTARSSGSRKPSIGSTRPSNRATVNRSGASRGSATRPSSRSQSARPAHGNRGAMQPRNNTGTNRSMQPRGNGNHSARPQPGGGAGYHGGGNHGGGGQPRGGGGGGNRGGGQPKVNRGGHGGGHNGGGR